MPQGGRTRQLTIRTVYLQRWATTTRIILTCIHILYLRHEDAIFAILYMGLPISTTIVSEWLNYLIFHDDIKCISAMSILYLC